MAGRVRHRCAAGRCRTEVALPIRGLPAAAGDTWRAKSGSRAAARSGNAVSPAKSGTTIFRARSGNAVVPARSGKNFLPARSGTIFLRARSDATAARSAAEGGNAVLHTRSRHPLLLLQPGLHAVRDDPTSPVSKPALPLKASHCADGSQRSNNLPRTQRSGLTASACGRLLTRVNPSAASQ